jgi:hypothetical protein
MQSYDCLLFLSRYYAVFKVLAGFFSSSLAFCPVAEFFPIYYLIMVRYSPQAYYI